MIVTSHLFIWIPKWRESDSSFIKNEHPHTQPKPPISYKMAASREKSEISTAAQTTTGILEGNGRFSYCGKSIWAGLTFLTETGIQFPGNLTIIRCMFLFSKEVVSSWYSIIPLKTKLAAIHSIESTVAEVQTWAPLSGLL